MPAMFSFPSVPWACNFCCTLILLNETVAPLSNKTYVLSLLPLRCIETWTIWRKLVTSLLWLIDAARTLTALLSRPLNFLSVGSGCASWCIHWYRTQCLYNLLLHVLCLDIRNISVASSLLRNDHSNSCSWIVNNFEILWVPSASGQWSLCVCLVSLTINLALKIDVVENRLSLFALLGSSSLRSPF